MIAVHGVLYRLHLKEGSSVIACDSAGDLGSRLQNKKLLVLVVTARANQTPSRQPGGTQGSLQKQTILSPFCLSSFFRYYA